MLPDCVNYEGYKDKHGYGRVRRKGKKYKAHRLAYCEAKGIPIDEIAGLVVRHKCDNPSCINAEHLLLGTQANNVDDMVSRNRNRPVRGSKNGGAKLSEQDVIAIRSMYIPRSKDFNQVTIAKMYGVHQATIGKIVLGRRWKE